MNIPARLLFWIFLSLFIVEGWSEASSFPSLSRGVVHVSGSTTSRVSVASTGRTVFIDGGMTNSSRDIVLPPPPPWASRVRLSIAHESMIGFGHETDGDSITWWDAASRIDSGWQLRNGTVPLAGCRTSGQTVQTGMCDPWDGQLDWSGQSGAYAAAPHLTSGVATVDVASLPLGLTISTRARSAWTISISWPNIPGVYFGQLWWLNSCSWTATCAYEWLP